MYVLSNGNECYDVRSVLEVHLIADRTLLGQKNCLHVTEIGFKRLLQISNFRKVFLFKYIILSSPCYSSENSRAFLHF